MKKHLANTKFNFILVFIILLTGIVFLLNLYSNSGSSNVEYHLLTDDVIIEHPGTKTYTGNIRNYILKDEHNDDFYTMYMKIPKHTLTRPILFFDNVNNGLNIYLNDKLVYTYKMDVPSGTTLCQANFKVPLENAKEGDIIKMEIRALSQSTTRGMPTCFLYNAYECDTAFLQENLSHQIIIVFSFILFFLGLIICAVSSLKESVIKKVLILSIICILIAFHSLAAYKLIQTMSDFYVLDVYLELCSRSLIVSFIGLYMYFNDSEEHKYHLIVPIGSTLHIIIATIMQLTRKGYIYDSLNMLILFAVILIIDIGHHSITKLRKHKNKKLIIVFTLGFLVSALGLIVFTSISSEYLIELFNLLPFIMLGLTGILYINLLQQVYESYKAIAENNALEQLAYMDPLTGLSNRNYLEKYTKSTLVNIKETFTLYMFDLNSLKMINDTYGHQEGDLAIKTFAICLQTVFYDGFCVRLGGDEFVAIIENSYFNISLIHKLQDKLAEVSSGLSYNISFSYGSTNFEGIDAFDINSVLKEADAKMYTMKENFHKAI